MANSEATGSKKVRPGPTADRVAENIRQVRTARGMRQEDLSNRLSELGHPIASTGITKIEKGLRKVTVDDLMALAIALEVTPNRLLLVSPVPEAADPLEPGGILFITPGLVVPGRDAWIWACGEGRIPGLKNWRAPRVFDWMTENRPHRPPVRYTFKDWQVLDPFIDRYDELSAEVRAKGYDPRALYDAVVFEAHDPDNEEHMAESHQERES